MGSKLGPTYACLFVGYQEHLITQQYEGPFPHLIKRYIDDIVGATSLPLHQLQSFIDFVCNFHPALKFTFEISETQLPFLAYSTTYDALVYKRRADVRGKLSMKTDALDDYKKAIFIQTQRMQVIPYFLYFPLIIYHLKSQKSLGVIS